MAATFAKDGIGWQAQQLQQRVSEWAEFQFSSNAPDVPLESIPGLAPWVATALLRLLLALAIAWLGWVVFQIARPVVRQWLAQKPLATQPRRSQSAPSAAAWLQRSRDWQQQGNYRQACRALYMAMLEHLHETQQVSRSPSRTDGQYGDRIRELSQPGPYRVLLKVHEQLCFGQADVSADVFQRCQEAYRAIEQAEASPSRGGR